MSHPRTYERRSPEEERRLESLLESVNSIVETAAELGREASALRSRLLQSGFLSNDGMSGVQAEDPASDDRARRRAHPDYFEPYFETLDMVREGLDVEEIAKRRGIPPRVVLTHLERLTDKSEPFDIAHLLPLAADYTAISEAVRAANSPHVTRVQKELGDTYSAEEIRLVRLHMRQVAQAAG